MTAHPLGWRAPEELGRAPHRGVRTAVCVHPGGAE